MRRRERYLRKMIWNLKDVRECREFLKNVRIGTLGNSIYGFKDARGRLVKLSELTDDDVLHICECLAMTEMSKEIEA